MTEQHAENDYCWSETQVRIQESIWQNKIAKGFNTTNVALEVALLVAEVGNQEW